MVIDEWKTIDGLGKWPIGDPIDAVESQEDQNLDGSNGSALSRTADRTCIKTRWD